MSGYIFGTPAFIKDLESGAAQAIMDAVWSSNVEGWVQQAMPSSNPHFYDPSNVTIPSSAAARAVTWVPLPGRLRQYYSDNPPVSPPNPYKLGMTDIYQLADTGYYSSENIPLPPIPVVMCPEADWSSGSARQPFGPYGPRGWQDEYCEWAVQRNPDNKIVRVDFTCENPEYWYTLWSVSPERVVELYNAILNDGATGASRVTVTMADLQLVDANGNVVVDPGTGRPAYNPLNKWNNGPVAIRGTGSATDRGGAIHLTSTPNTLQTELGLTGASTIMYLYNAGTDNPQQARLCCGQYGQSYRHSDPTIGFEVGKAVAGQQPPLPPFKGHPSLVNLANPLGLYIQKPESSAFSFASGYVPGVNLPADAKASDVWGIVRGVLDLIDPVTQSYFPNYNNADGKGNFILHATARIPQAWLDSNPDMTLNDILINGAAVDWGAQIVAQMSIALYARPIPAESLPETASCVSGVVPAGQPLQCMYAALWNGYNSLTELSPTGKDISLASNTTFVPNTVRLGDRECILVVTTGQLSDEQRVTIAVLAADGSQVDPSFKTQVIGYRPAAYAVPGNSYPGTYTAVYFQMLVPDVAEIGLRGIQVSINGGGPSYSLPAAFRLAGGVA